MAQGDPLPAVVHLLGRATQLPEVADGARALIWSERLRFARYPQVRAVQPIDVPHALIVPDWEGDFQHPLLCLAAWLAAKEHGPATGQKPGWTR